MKRRRLRLLEARRFCCPGLPGDLLMCCVFVDLRQQKPELEGGPELFFRPTPCPSVLLTAALARTLGFLKNIFELFFGYPSCAFCTLYGAPRENFRVLAKIIRKKFENRAERGKGVEKNSKAS